MIDATPEQKNRKRPIHHAKSTQIATLGKPASHQDQSREALLKTIAELRCSNAELHMLNMEIQSTNVGLQETNKELETSNEELQTINEQLIMVNGELQIDLIELRAKLASSLA